MFQFRRKNSFSRFPPKKLYSIDYRKESDKETSEQTQMTISTLWQFYENSG